MKKPLSGCRVAVTRSQEAAQKLTKQLEGLGAEPVSVPLIEIVFPASNAVAVALEKLASGVYSWAVITSSNGAHVVAEWFEAQSARNGFVQSFKVAAVGAQSAAVLENVGLRVTVAPTVQSAAGLVDAFPSGENGENVAAFLGDLASDTIVSGLVTKGYTVDRLEAYKAKAPVYDAAEIKILQEQVSDCNAILFTSPSTVKRFVKLVGVELVPHLVVCIGPSTADAAKQAGIEHVVAQHYSQQGLLAALCDAWV